MPIATSNQLTASQESSHQWLSLPTYWLVTLSTHKAFHDNVPPKQDLSSWQLPIVDTAGFRTYTVGKDTAVQ
jgi:hypothetical protein